MAIAGFSLIKEGPAAGLVWIDFKFVEVHGDRGTPEYQLGMQQKAAFAQKCIVGSLAAGIRHFNLKLQELTTLPEVLRSYMMEGGFAVDMLKDKNVREKFEGIVKKAGVDEARIVRGRR